MILGIPHLKFPIFPGLCGIKDELFVLHPFGYLCHRGYHNGSVEFILLQHSCCVSLCLPLWRSSCLLRLEVIEQKIQPTDFGMMTKVSI
ncbi:hypothetical protein CEXT_553091 [Caerostris extrusa]|uniref:Uncharacterized protein n=1 Tax=Caerostris extrusa TaxID=172846 RepID=A0AAV4XFF8_CAEEX|nr:hypothetical protein CEXT_553091 [Caerostris extrusa]